MKSALGHPIQLRLDAASQAQYEAEAASRNLPLAAYLRERLAASNHLAHELSALRQSLAEIAAATAQNGQPAAKANADPRTFSMQVETLLLLRVLMMRTGRESDLTTVHSDLQRLDLPVWRGA